MPSDSPGKKPPITKRIKKKYDDWNNGLLIPGVGKEDPDVEWVNSRLRPGRDAVNLWRDAQEEWMKKGRQIRDSDKDTPPEELHQQLLDHMKRLPDVREAETVATRMYKTALYEARWRKKPSRRQREMLGDAWPSFVEERKNMLKALNAEEAEQKKARRGVEALQATPQPPRQDQDNTTNPFRRATAPKPSSNSPAESVANQRVARTLQEMPRLQSVARQADTPGPETNPFRRLQQEKAKKNTMR